MTDSLDAIANRALHASTEKVPDPRVAELEAEVERLREALQRIVNARDWQSAWPAIKAAGDLLNAPGGWQQEGVRPPEASGDAALPPERAAADAGSEEHMDCYQYGTKP